MIFGDKNEFAIEAMTEAHLAPPSPVWGRMCLHIGPEILGDITDEHCALYGAYRGFKELLTNKDRLWDDSFSGLTDEEIHNLVRNAIYGDDDRSTEACLLDSRRYGRFDFLTNWGEQFDGFASVIVQNDPLTTTVFHRPHSAFARTRQPGAFVVASCATDAFHAACEDFVNWFEDEERRLTRKETEQSP